MCETEMSKLPERRQPGYEHMAHATPALAAAQMPELRGGFLTHQHFEWLSGRRNLQRVDAGK